LVSVEQCRFIVCVRPRWKVSQDINGKMATSRVQEVCIKRCDYSICIILIIVAGCGLEPFIPPDQDQFEDLETLKNSGQAVARLYGSNAPFIYTFHGWFVVKPADSTTFVRWEGWPEWAEPYGHVRVDLFPLEEYLPLFTTYVLDQYIGPEAEPFVEFIQQQSPFYPARDCFNLVAGPNSNTYIQWVIDNSGWDAALPPLSTGADVQPECP